MDRLRGVGAVFLMAGLSACGGGGSGSETPASLVSADPPVTGGNTVDPTTTDVQPLATTVADAGLNVRTSTNIAGGNVSLAIDSGFGITIATDEGTTIRFDERNRTFYRIFGGYSALDETDLTVIALPGQDAAGLTYATYGFWAESDDPGLIDGDSAPSQGGAFFGGNNTPIDNMPTTGSAVYSGFAIGNDSNEDGGDFRGGEGLIVGTSTFTADFANSSISGLFELNNAEQIPYTTITLADTAISANTFEGIASSDLDHTGTIRGQFFGPGAEELSGLGQLTGSSQIAIAFGAKR